MAWARDLVGDRRLLCGPGGAGMMQKPMVLLEDAREHLVDHANLVDPFEHRAVPQQLEYLLRERIDTAVLDAYPELAAP